MTALTHVGTIETGIPALGLMEDDVILLTLDDVDPVMLYRPYNGFPLTLIARYLLLALDMGNLTSADPAFRTTLEGVAASRLRHKRPTSHQTERPGLTLVSPLERLRPEKRRKG